MKLKIDYEWEDPMGAKGRELRATWSRFQVRVDDRVVTKVEDLIAHSVRSAIYIPLYPIAEWLATHWWLIFNELQVAGRRSAKDYATRHNIRFGREGYSFPDLLLRPIGSSILMEWKPFHVTGQQVSFLGRGRAELDCEETKNCLSEFIDGVVARLESEGVTGTLLQEEWKAIQLADREEATFCRFAAKLGLDAYSMTEPERGLILRAYETVHADVTEEFFTAADWENLETDLNWMREARRSIDKFVDLRELRSAITPIDPLRTPWREGYRVARELRTFMKIEDIVLKEHADIADALGIRMEELSTKATSGVVHARFDALVATNAEGKPGFFVASRGWSQAFKFAFFRALFEYLAYRTTVGLVSRAPSERQKRSRAFAAEFLVPASMLRQRVRSDTVADETIDEISAEFDVSPLVVRHQLDNHNVAVVVAS